MTAYRLNINPFWRYIIVVFINVQNLAVIAAAVSIMKVSMFRAFGLKTPPTHAPKIEVLEDLTPYMGYNINGTICA